MEGSAGSILEATDFIATARELADTTRVGRPRETNLRRAVSTAYYALFHCLAACCADTVVGGIGSNRNMRAWYRTYRALEHGIVRNRCLHRDTANFPDAIRAFANAFVIMQDRRYNADYAPDVTFTKAAVVQDIASAEDAINRLSATAILDRRAFAVHVLFGHNRG